MTAANANYTKCDNTSNCVALLFSPHWPSPPPAYWWWTQTCVQGTALSGGWAYTNAFHTFRWMEDDPGIKLLPLFPCNSLKCFSVFSCSWSILGHSIHTAVKTNLNSLWSSLEISMRLHGECQSQPTKKRYAHDIALYLVKIVNLKSTVLVHIITILNILLSCFDCKVLILPSLVRICKLFIVNTHCLSFLVWLLWSYIAMHWPLCIQTGDDRTWIENVTKRSYYLNLHADCNHFDKSRVKFYCT